MIVYDINCVYIYEQSLYLEVYIGEFIVKLNHSLDYEVSEILISYFHS